MKVERKPRETNQQLIRRFNREVLIDGRLQEFKDREFFTKLPSKRMRRKQAIRATEIAKSYQDY